MVKETQRKSQTLHESMYVDLTEDAFFITLRKDNAEFIFSITQNIISKLVSNKIV